MNDKFNDRKPSSGKGGQRSSPGRRGRGSSNKRNRTASCQNDRFADDNKQSAGKTSSLNDLSWYTRYPDLIAAAGAIPYPYRPGMAMPTSAPLTVQPTSSTTASVSGTSYIPGVMALDWLPSVGISNNVTDPASIVCKEMYARVRAAFSGSLEADAPDFLMYVMALDSIFAFIAHLKRIYRTISVWTPQNYSLPDTVLHALGCSDAFIKDARANKTKFWGNINELVYQSRKFTCPAVMDIFNRHYWMSDNLYADAAEPNAQFYCFRMAGLYQFEELPLANDAATKGSGLHMIKMPAFASVDDAFNFGKGLIDALVAWDTAYTINGYLLKAYQDTPSFTVETLQQDELLVPVFVPEVLSQIENSTTLPLMTGVSFWDNFYSNPVATTAADVKKDVFAGMNVVQNVLTNAVIANPQIGVDNPTSSTTKVTTPMVAAGFYMDSPMVSVRSTTPTVADTVIASRLKCSTADAHNITIGSNQVMVFTPIAGTEIPLAWWLYNQMSTSGLYIPNRVVSWKDAVVTFDQTGSLKSWLSLAQFDWHPFIRMDMIDATSPQYMSYTTTWFGDTHNMTQMSEETLKQLHRVCVYSEFNAFNA